MTEDHLSLIDEAAQRLAALAAAAGAPLAMPDWLARAREAGALRREIAWRNTAVQTHLWARLHVEYFAIPGEIAVLHVCAFPQLHCALPIFGFDVIAGREKATGCFLDLSPSVPGASPRIADWGRLIGPFRAALGEARSLPEWTAIFSDQVVAVRPRDLAAFQAGLALGEQSLGTLLGATQVPRADPAAMHAAQMRYIEGQRRNERTRRMLAACIGEALAEDFITESLFPKPIGSAALAA